MCHVVLLTNRGRGGLYTLSFTVIFATDTAWRVGGSKTPLHGMGRLETPKTREVSLRNRWEVESQNMWEVARLSPKTGGRWEVILKKSCGREGETPATPLSIV